MKKLFFTRWSLWLCLAASTLTAKAQEITPFKENDRVVFLGNSITDGGHYHSYIWLYYMTRFPSMNLTVLNAGIGGDRVWDMLKRLDGDVFSKQPSVLITTFGMNDSGYFEYNGSEPEKFANQKVAESQEGYKQMEQRYKQLVDTKIVLLGSSPYDEDVRIPENTPLKDKNKAMLRIVDFQRESAKNNGWQFFDFNTAMTAINKRMQQQDPTFTLSGNDRVHPDLDGHMVMAYLILKAQGFAGKKVAGISIDAPNRKVVSAEGCNLSEIRKTARGLSFDYYAAALPYPLDTVARGWGSKKSQYDAIAVVPFMEEMNQELLRITGLKGKYNLLIDGQQIGSWEAAEYARGINLAAIDSTPQYQQALRVMYLNEERWEIERRLRDYAWVQYNFFQPKGLLDANNRKAIQVFDKHKETDGWLRAKSDLYAKAMYPEVRKAWQQQMDMLLQTIRAISVPVKRTITLERI
ncbi:SGNH/GDSL hydrolase family protein [Sphingobacterium suaedae]|uniref:SGNH/GDSL hydrolase family protein n=1 Tax=Sphingobacterium suaedae TaxID=1686402 RepID=A0ABW5KML2_9SPHI